MARCACMWLRVCLGGFVLSPDFVSSVRAFRFRFLVSWDASLVEEVTARVTTFLSPDFFALISFPWETSPRCRVWGEGGGHEGWVASLLG